MFLVLVYYFHIDNIEIRYYNEECKKEFEMITRDMIAKFQKEASEQAIKNCADRFGVKEKKLVDFDRDERITTVYSDEGIDYITIRSVRKKHDEEMTR